LATDGNESSVSRLDRYAPVEKGPDDHWMGGWVGPRDVLDDVEKRQLFCSCLELKLRSFIPACSLVTLLSYPGSSFIGRPIIIWGIVHKTRSQLTTLLTVATTMMMMMMMMIMIMMIMMISDLVDPYRRQNSTVSPDDGSMSRNM
jgi:hypothetical protein